MKKIFPAVMMVILILTGICFAGEKEELVLEQKYLEEKITRIRFQQQLLNSEEQKALSRRQEILKKLEAFSKPEPKTEKKKEGQGK